MLTGCREEYIFDFITRLGTVVYDNDPNARKPNAPVQPIKGVTTGRNYLGQLNGSMTVDDIFDMYAAVLLNGFTPDTMLVHPMAWLMWVKDPVLREFAIQAGGGSFFANFTGNPAQLGNKFYNYNGLGLGQGQLGQYTNGQLTGGEVSHPEAGNYQQMNSAPMLPNYLGIPFRILVSPFINFNPETRTTDVLMFNSKNLGALIVQEDPHVKSWEDGQYNMNHMSIEETHGFGILNEGQAIAIAKNVKIRPNEFTMPAPSVFNLSEANNTLDQGSPSFLSLCHPPHPLPLHLSKSCSTPLLAWLFHCSAPWLKSARIFLPRCHPPHLSQGAEITPPRLPKVRKSEYQPARQRGNFRRLDDSDKHRKTGTAARSPSSPTHSSQHTRPRTILRSFHRVGR